MQMIYTGTGKPQKEKITKARQEELERDWRDRNKRLKEMSLPKETFEQFLEWVYGRGKKEKKKTKYGASIKTPVSKTTIKEKIDSYISKPADRSPTDCALKPSPKYTGDKIIGIATMHKSNLVPIFSNEEAKDVAKMRR